jgi:hypothetical protein
LTGIEIYAAKLISLLDWLDIISAAFWQRLLVEELSMWMTLFRNSASDIYPSSGMTTASYLVLSY